MPSAELGLELSHTNFPSSGEPHPEAEWAVGMTIYISVTDKWNIFTDDPLFFS